MRSSYAGYKIIQFKANFYHNNGSHKVTTLFVDYKGTVTPLTPSSTGFPDIPTGAAFDQWYANELCTVPFDFSVPVTKDVDLYAGWKGAKYSVTLNPGAGTGTPVTTSDLEPYSAYKLPECPFAPPPGMTFDYWDCGGTHYQPGKSYTVPNANTVFEAKYKDFEISLVVSTEQHDGSVLSSVSGTGSPVFGEGGTASLGTHKPNVGDEVAVSASPASGYELLAIYYSDGYTIGDDITAAGKFAAKNGYDQVIVRFRKIKPVYTTVSGDGQVWIRGQYNPAKFTIERNIDNASAFSHFTGIRVDGKTVPTAEHTAVSGSVKLGPPPGYLESLKDGSHTLTADFDDGEATAQFTVRPSPGHTKGDASGMPKTGDRSSLPVWLILGLACLAGLAALRRKSRRG